MFYLLMKIFFNTNLVTMQDVGLRFAEKTQSAPLISFWNVRKSKIYRLALDLCQTILGKCIQMDK